MPNKLPLSVLFLGLVAGYLLAHAAPFAAQSALAESGSHKWEHFCFLKSASIDELNKDANNTGKQGWELVSSTINASNNSTLLCFKRPLP